MIEAVLFDMDGVIVDSEPTHERVSMRLLDRLGVKLSKEEYDKYIGSTNTYMYSMLKKKYNLEPSLEELVSSHEREVYQDFKLGNQEPIQGIPRLLRELRSLGIKTAVASSSPRYGIETVIDKFQIRDYFDVVVSGEELERPKPAPDIFLTAARELGVKPENCVVIEDSHNGVLAAKAAGMKCIGFNNGGLGNQDISMADLVVESMMEINVEFLRAMS